MMVMTAMCGIFQVCDVKQYFSRGCTLLKDVKCAGVVSEYERESNQEMFERLGRKEAKIGSCLDHFNVASKNFKSRFIYHPKCLAPDHNGSVTISKASCRPISEYMHNEFLMYLGKMIPVGAYTCAKCNIKLFEELKNERRAAEPMDIDPLDQCSSDDSNYDPSKKAKNPSKKPKSDAESEEHKKKMAALQNLLECNGFKVCFQFLVVFLTLYINVSILF